MTHGCTAKHKVSNEYDDLRLRCLSLALAESRDLYSNLSKHCFNVGSGQDFWIGRACLMGLN